MALTTAAEEVRSALARTRGALVGVGGRAAAELGAFAAGRIDADRFATLFDDAPTLDTDSATALERALDVLTGLQASDIPPLTLELSAGADVCAAAAGALGEAGRAFGAARAAELARCGRYRPDEHAALFGSLPFHLWTRAERRLAPPLVVELDGGDIAAAGLAHFLDGAQHIVLVARGAAPPAPLARLVSPEVLVLQTDDPAGLEVLTHCAGPAIALLLSPADSDAALFLHDPSAGGALAARLQVTRLPERSRPGGSARVSHFQRTQELELLRVLATQAAAPTTVAPGEAGAGGRTVEAGGATGLVDAGTATGQVETGGGTMAAAGARAGDTDDASAAPSPADRLAAWLLRQGELHGDPAS